MSDQPDKLLLVYLRRIDQRLESLERNIANLGRRMTGLEISVSGLRRDNALMFEMLAQGSQRADEADVRVDRIERRLDLVPGVPGES